MFAGKKKITLYPYERLHNWIALDSWWSLTFAAHIRWHRLYPPALSFGNPSWAQTPKKCRTSCQNMRKKKPQTILYNRQAPYGGQKLLILPFKSKAHAAECMKVEAWPVGKVLLLNPFNRNFGEDVFNCGLAVDLKLGIVLKQGDVDTGDWHVFVHYIENIRIIFAHWCCLFIYIHTWESNIILKIIQLSWFVGRDIK